MDPRVRADQARAHPRSRTRAERAGRERDDGAPRPRMQRQRRTAPADPGAHPRPRARRERSQGRAYRAPHPGRARPELDDAPVSQGLLVAPAPAAERPVEAKALSHLNVKWPWLADQLAPHTHLLRLSYGRLGEPEPAVTVEGALRDIRTLTGVTIAAEAVTDHLLARWNGTLPPLPPEYRGRVRALEEQVCPLGGVALTGAWVAWNRHSPPSSHMPRGAKGLI